MTSMTTADLEQLVEGHDLEAKLAAGRDGRGELPSSCFETYSAFANTDGGIVLLGVEELPDGTLAAMGITEPVKLVRVLWDGLNKPHRVNANLLREQDVEPLDVEGKAIIRVMVPRATRRQRSVYVGRPAAMRMPVETALRGSVSDCRNRRLHDMFRYACLGEQAGSGIPKT